jgi:hypothetical protein
MVSLNLFMEINNLVVVFSARLGYDSYVVFMILGVLAYPVHAFACPIYDLYVCSMKIYDTTISCIFLL